MKKILSLLLALSLALSITACGEKQPLNSSTESSVSNAAEDKAHYPITLTDQAGREVTIEEEPQKLVSGYYISTSLLIALNLDEKIVGIEAKAGSRSIYKLSAPT